jgi:hypothetical protein
VSSTSKTFYNTFFRNADITASEFRQAQDIRYLFQMIQKTVKNNLIHFQKTFLTNIISETNP